MAYWLYQEDSMDQQKFDEKVNAEIALRIRNAQEEYALDQGKDAILAAKRLMEDRLRDINGVLDMYQQDDAPVAKSDLVGQVIYYVQNLDQHNGEIMRAFAALIKIGR